MTNEDINKRCTLAASHLIATGLPDPGPISSAYLLGLVNKAVRVGAHIGLNAVEEILGQPDERFHPDEASAP